MTEPFLKVFKSENLLTPNIFFVLGVEKKDILPNVNVYQSLSNSK